MDIEHPTTDSSRKLERWPKVIVAMLLIAAIGWLLYVVSEHPRNSQKIYLQDTEYTLKFDGFLWGNPHVEDNIVILARLGPLEKNTPYPPYYKRADNENAIRLDNRLYGDCKGNNQIPEIPANSITCYLVPIISR